jgi:DNA-binding response OmpR family regulator
MRILIVDDSAVTRKIIQRELEPGGFEIIFAEDGEQALIMAKSDPPDLITLDVDMPHLDGFQTCANLRSLSSASNAGALSAARIPIVFITSSDSEEERAHGFEVGATDFLAKPFAQGELLKIVNRILKPQNILRGTTALVVEDSDFIRHAVSDILRRQGVTVLEAADGGAALEWARNPEVHLDLIVTDYIMPEMDGEELCSRIRNDLKLHDLPIIVLSGVESKSAIVGLFKAGATDFLIKPFAIEELLARINVHLQISLLNQQLTLTNTQMMDDLSLAEEAQRSAIHDRVDVEFINKSVLFTPYGGVSGDVYDFSVNSKGELCAFLGDATGHGMAAALMTMMVQSALDSIGGDAAVDKLMEQLDHLISERSGHRFVTGVYARISSSGLLDFSSAGHPPLIVLPKSGDPRVYPDVGGLPFGMTSFSLPFGHEQVQLSSGDRVFLYSDGITEWEDPDHHQYGTEGLLNYLAHHKSPNMQEVVSGVMNDLESFARGTKCNDDLTFIGLEFAG